MAIGNYSPYTLRTESEAQPQYAINAAKEFDVGSSDGSFLEIAKQIAEQRARAEQEARAEAAAERARQQALAFKMQREQEARQRQREMDARNEAARGRNDPNAKLREAAEKESLLAKAAQARAEHEAPPMKMTNLLNANNAYMPDVNSMSGAQRKTFLPQGSSMQGNINDPSRASLSPGPSSGIQAAPSGGGGESPGTAFERALLAQRAESDKEAENMRLAALYGFGRR